MYQQIISTLQHLLLNNNLRHVGIALFAHAQADTGAVELQKAFPIVTIVGVELAHKLVAQAGRLAWVVIPDVA